MDVKTRDGNKKRFGGKLSLSTFNSKLLLEGPLKNRVPKAELLFLLSLMQNHRTSIVRQNIL
jgi:hypothetical protein